MVNSRGKKLLLFLALVICLATAFRSVIFQGRTLTALPGMAGILPRAEKEPVPPVMDTSSAYIDEPLARLAARQLANGQFPHWNPHNGLGQPLHANMQSAILSPFRWPALIHHATWLRDLALLSRIATAALLTFLLARHLGLARLSAGAAALAFSLTGYFILHINMHHLSVEVLLPGLLWALLRLAEKPTPGRGWILALFTWGSWVGGNPEATLVSAIAAIFFLFPGCQQSKHPRLFLLKATGWALLGTLLAGPFLLPGLEHLANGLHHHTGLTGLDHYRPWTMAAFLLPGYYGSPHSQTPPWFGISLLLLALYGTVSRNRPANFPTRTLTILGFLILAKAIGFPGLNEIGQIPGLQMMLFYKYGLPAAALALALLAGRGLEALSQLQVPKPALFTCAAGLALAAVGCHLWNLDQAKSIPGLNLTLHPWTGLWPLGALPALALLTNRNLLAMGAAIILGLELVAAVPQARPHRCNPFTPPPFAQKLLQLKKEGHPVRVVSMAGGALSPNISAALGIDDIRINDAVVIGRFGRFARTAIDGYMRAGVLEPGLFGPIEENALARSEFFKHKAYFRQLAKEGNQAEKQQITTAFFTRENQVMSALGITHILLQKNNQVQLIPNHNCPGRAFLPQQVTQAPHPDAALAWVSKNRKRLLEKAVVEDPPPNWTGAQATNPNDQVRSRYTPEGKLIIETSLASPRLLVIAEAWYPGRYVLVDGKEHECRPADLCFTAILAPRGKHRIETRIRPTSFNFGLLLTITGLAAGGLITLLNHYRRQPPTPDNEKDQ